MNEKYLILLVLLYVSLSVSNFLRVGCRSKSGYLCVFHDFE